MVRRRYRKAARTSSRVESRPWEVARRATFIDKMRGRCYNCLGRDHKIAHCRDPTKCWVCLHSGHTSSSCPQRRQRSKRGTTDSPRFQTLMEKAKNTMDELNLRDRPEVAYCYMPLSDELQQRIDFFESRTMLVWIRQNRPHTEPHHVVQAFQRRFGMDPQNLQVSRHQPEDFLVQFTLRRTWRS